MHPESDQDDPMRMISVRVRRKHQLGTLTKLCLTPWFDIFPGTGNQAGPAPKESNAKPGR